MQDFFDFFFLIMSFKTPNNISDLIKCDQEVLAIPKVSPKCNIYHSKMQC